MRWLGSSELFVLAPAGAPVARLRGRLLAAPQLHSADDSRECIQPAREQNQTFDARNLRSRFGSEAAQQPPDRDTRRQRCKKSLGLTPRDQVAERKPEGQQSDAIEQLHQHEQARQHTRDLRRDEHPDRDQRHRQREQHTR